ncbi:HdeD family acid-resistance protein [Leucobacter sp. USHLN153]|uniref:HdeD family acid-resistance protein n=1 Tax=Leucobacter sp. USHLN153 TaxID=3081268 RepID=UPI003019835C
MSQQPIPFGPNDPRASGPGPVPGAARTASLKTTAITIGVIVALLGLGLVVWPFFAASWILVLLFGTALIANGIALLVGGRSSALAVFGGVLLIVAGLISFAFTGATARVLVSFAGFGLIGIGALWIAIGARWARLRPGIAIAPGVVLVLGGILAIVWPGIALVLAAIVAGAVLLAIGVAIIVGATRARVRPEEPGQTTIII